MDMDLDQIIRVSLSEFVARIFDHKWRGREREAIALYVLGFLQRQCRPQGILSDPTQIGVEVAVPGVRSVNPKGRVNKDLVIWPEPGMTLWNENWEPCNSPLAVLEWKVFRRIHRNPGLSADDLRWLKDFTTSQAGSTGYAVSIDLAERSFRARVARVAAGVIDEEWVRL